MFWNEAGVKHHCIRYRIEHGWHTHTRAYIHLAEVWWPHVVTSLELWWMVGSPQQHGNAHKLTRPRPSIVYPTYCLKKEGDHTIAMLIGNLLRGDSHPFRADLSRKWWSIRFWSRFGYFIAGETTYTWCDLADVREVCWEVQCEHPSYVCCRYIYYHRLCLTYSLTVLNHLGIMNPI